MAIDRAATLRNAEKLLRQGKLDQAIAEYTKVVEEEPRDWNTANLVGDLYLRAGKTDKAVEQYIRVADSLNDEGFFQKASALYKKILKIKPEDEHALLHAADIAAAQGLLVDARSYLNSVLERRRGRKDQRGVAQIKIRLGSLDPADFAARLDAARSRIEIKDAQGALRDFKEIAAELSELARDPEAVEALQEALALAPDDPEIRERMLGVYLATGNYARARECATTVDQLKALAAKLDESGQADEALAALGEASRLDPADAELKAHLARTYVGRGDFERAATYLTIETAGDDPKLLLTVAEIRLREGQIEEGLAIARRLLEADPERRQDIAVVGWTVAEKAPEAGYQLVELAAEQAVTVSDWPSAAAALQEFVTRVPNHIPALMRLVEICVDGGLEATMYSAQGQLADAYIAAGAAAEARFIAEDLVAREPWERANVERFRRTLELMGEPDPDAVIAERLSGQAPFLSTDLSPGAEDLPPFEGVAAPAPPRSKQPVEAAPPTPAGAKAPSKKPDPFALGVNAVDLGNILGDFEAPPAPPPTAKGRSESVEVDLSIVLQDIKTPGAEAPASGTSGDLDAVFAHLRDEAGRKTALDAFEGEYRRGLALYNAGDIDGSIPALESASRAPRLRFATASLLGRIYSQRGQTPKAIEWFERASQAPAPTPDEGQLLLYELASALDSVGEVARALALFMELQADAGDYRDVSERIDRLTKAQA